MNDLKHRFGRWLSYICFCCVITACADWQLVNHSVQMDLRRDDQQTAVLDLKYGASKSITGLTPYDLQRGIKLYYEGVTGAMPRPDFIYVKWEDLNTGKIYEDTAGMTGRLPRDLENKTVIIWIKGPQLYIYVMSEERRPPDQPPFGPSTYQDYKLVMIYPDQKQPQKN